MKLAAMWGEREKGREDVAVKKRDPENGSSSSKGEEGRKGGRHLGSPFRKEAKEEKGACVFSPFLLLY